MSRAHYCSERDCKRRVLADHPDAHPWTPSGFAEDLRSAYYRRDASRFELLLDQLVAIDKEARAAGGEYD